MGSVASDKDSVTIAILVCQGPFEHPMADVVDVHLEVGNL